MAYSSTLLPTTLPTSDPAQQAMPLPVWWSLARSPDQVRPLTGEQCRRLLSGDEWGWLSFPQQPGAPPVPAAYRLHGEALLISSASAAATVTAAPLVLFRVDHFDVGRQHGWTVVASGSLRRSEPDDAAAGSADQSDLRLGLAHLAGRWITAAPPDGRPTDGG